MKIRINIESIPQSAQRYNTIGDYWYDEAGVLQVRVTEMQSEIYSKMVIIHELVEEAITKHRGLTEPEILAFDTYYETKRKMGMVSEDSEPGFCNEAPYLREHTLATGIEMMMCALAGESWSDYEQTLNNM